MTETIPLEEFVREFRNRLPQTVDAQLHAPQKLSILIQKAALNGWTARALATECGRDTEGVSNAGGVVMHRLGWCAEHPPVKAVKQINALPFCSDDCRQRAGWIEDTNGHPTHRCPCRTPA